MRGAATFLTCAAVLWHAAFGCCAHQGCSASSNAVEFGRAAREGCVATQACRHHAVQSTHAPQGEDAICGAHAPTRGSCPAEGSGHCSDGICVFAAPLVSGVAFDVTDAGHWAPLSAADPSNEIFSSSVRRLVESSPPPSGGLRSHLALRVLTL